MYHNLPKSEWLDQNETVHVRRRRNPTGLSVLRHHWCRRSGIQRELLGLVISAASGAAVLRSRGVLWHPRGDSPRERGRRLSNLGTYSDTVVGGYSDTLGD